MGKNGQIKTLKNPKGGGRPKTEIDLTQLTNLCRLSPTYAEIATFFCCSEETIQRKIVSDEAFLTAYKKGINDGKLHLRRLQIQTATGREPRLFKDNDGNAVLNAKGRPILIEGEPPNPTMQIWLGKQLLGQVDRQEVTGKDGGPIEQRTSLSIDATTLASAFAILRDAGGVRVAVPGQPEPSLDPLHPA